MSAGMALGRATVYLPPSGLADLLIRLQETGYSVVGPQVRDGAIVYDVLERVEDLPWGWTDQQEAGYYRLSKAASDTAFGYNLGPQSWKKFLYPPLECILRAEGRNGDFRILEEGRPVPRYALFGARACELAAIQVLDRIFTGDQYVEAGYQARRQEALLVAVNCTRAAPTCFCTSMGTGPRAEGGFDLALTELPEGGFLMEVASARGAELAAKLDHQPATEDHRRQAQQAIAAAAAQIVRSIDTRDIVRRLYEAYASPHWDQIARRCLACANCTLVCPTCFCTTVEDSSSVPGDRAERWRKWDSCFTESFSYIHGGSVRTSVKSRYRQWLTHKLAAWVDQFEMFGCVGCGRCITWCPARIDLTEEVKQVLASPG